MRKQMWFIAGSFAVVGLFLSGCDVTRAASAAPSESTTAQLATLAEGRLLPLQTATLSFNANGQIAEILAKEGDVVQAGDVLARLDNTVLQADVAEAEANVAVAQANQVAYRRQLPRQIAAAEAEVKAAQAQQLHAAADRNNQPEILEAEAALTQAQYTQQQLQTALDQLSLYDRANGTQANKLRVQLQSAIAAVQAAQAHLAALRSGSPGDRAASAQVAAAAAAEKAAQARLDQLRAEASGTAADPYQAAIRQAEAALLTAQQALSASEIRVPFAGTIAQINLNLGEQATPGTPVIVLADLTGWQVETRDLTELKVPAVRMGQAVTMQFDALPGLELRGVVESIGQVSRLSSGDVVYPVKIKLLDSDPRLRWGMTALMQFEP